jgi:hypothetical protein
MYCGRVSYRCKTRQKRKKEEVGEVRKEEEDQHQREKLSLGTLEHALQTTLANCDEEPVSGWRDG